MRGTRDERFSYGRAIAAAVMVLTASTQADALARVAPIVSPPALSADQSPADISSDHGSAAFGHWLVDDGGLPVFRYTIDQKTDPAAAQPELNGRRDAWHQLGNGRAIADAFNGGYVQLWSQDRIYQWMNYYDAANQHFTGGYGYLNVDGKTYSTLYDDRAPGATTQRDFGIGYFLKKMTVAGLDVSERVYPPFADDPLLLHQVTLHNSSTTSRKVSWFEYWDVNPYITSLHQTRGLAAPTFDAATNTLAVAQLPDATDHDPLSIFAAALQGPVGGFEADSGAFFGPTAGLSSDGGRSAPAEVAADHLSGSLATPVPAGASGHTMFAFRAPTTLAPGQSVTLRYAYGYGHPDQIPQLLARYRAAADPYPATQRAWKALMPQASFGPGYAWLARELQWDAYMVRSGASYEECAGHHIISQGGYYQYDLGFQGAFRDPLQHMLPMIYTDPNLAREVLLYSAEEQPQVGGQIPYAIIPMCKPFHLGSSDDLDLWLLLSAAEYGLASRDVGFFDQPVSWSDGGSSTLWDHLKLAFSHQESLRGPHGGYLTGATGDWSDFSTQFLQMSESMLVAAQTAYVYPRLAELADLRGDHAFATQLRTTATGLRDVLGQQWTGGGWYSRGYSGDRQLGQGVIFAEPQPWALLSGAADASKARTLVGNLRRYLTGIGAPAGPAKIGSSQSPASNDPGVTERSNPPGGGVGDNHAVYVGGSWFALNGALTWALGNLDGQVPHARDYAFDEFLRNTLAAHATVYPNHWDGVLSVDDACRSWYSTDSAQCGVGLSTAYDTQIMHQPAWALYDAVKLAGIEPVQDGYRITPHLPMSAFSLRLPQVGIELTSGRLRGYVRPLRAGSLRMHVAVPAGLDMAHVIAFANGRRVPTETQAGLLVFTLPTQAGHASDWALVGAAGATRSPRCVSGRRIAVHLRAPRGDPFKSAVIFINGRRSHASSGPRRTFFINLRGLPKGTFRVRIEAITRRGRKVTAVRTFHTCRRYRRA